MRLRAKIHSCDIVPNRSPASTPKATLCQVVHIISDSERISTNFQAGEDNSKIHHSLSKRSGCINAILHCDEFDLMFLQERIEHTKIHHITAYTINFINNYTINKPGSNIFLQLVHAWPIHIRSHISIILIQSDGRDLLLREMKPDVFLAYIKLHLSAL